MGELGIEGRGLVAIRVMMITVFKHPIFARSLTIENDLW
jgi:hypothetical protein